MKKVFWINQIIFTAILLLIACKKEEPSSDKEYPNWPAVKTLKATNADSITAILNGTVNGYGLSTTVIFEYGTTTNYGNTVTAIQSPLTGDSVTNVCADISGLTPCTIYHFRVKAENSKWKNFYSADSIFITGHIGALTTAAAADIIGTPSGITATSGGNITDDGCLAVIERGVYWSTSESGLPPEVMNSPGLSFTNVLTQGTSSGNFACNLNGLTASTKYYLRSYFRNSAGIAYGNITSFSIDQLPEVTPLGATNITPESAILNAIINANGLSTTVSFEYGTTTDYGISAIASQSPATGDSTINVSADITGLISGTTYHFRLKAENSIGLVYSSDMVFTNDQCMLPVAETLASTYMGKDSVLVPGGSYRIFNKWTLNGTVDANGLLTTVTFIVGCRSPRQSRTAEQSPIGSYGHTHVSVVIDDRFLNSWCHSFYLEATNACGKTTGIYGTFNIP